MKKILKLNTLLFFASIMIFTSCNVDDDAPTLSSKNISISLEDRVIGIANSSTTTVNIPVIFSQVFNQLSRIVYTVNDVEFSKNVDTGGVTTNIEIDMTGLETASIVLTDFKILYADAEGFNTSVEADKNSAVVVAVVGGDLRLNLTWTDGLSNIDVAAWLLPLPTLPIDLFGNGNGSGNVERGICTNTNNESITLSGTLADGDYGYVVLPFDIGSNSIACELEVISVSTGINMYTFTIDDAQAGTSGGGQLLYPSAEQVLAITKSTGTSGEAIWSVTQI